MNATVNAGDRLDQVYAAFKEGLVTREEMAQAIVARDILGYINRKYPSLSEISRDEVYGKVLGKMSKLLFKDKAKMQQASLNAFVVVACRNAVIDRLRRRRENDSSLDDDSAGWQNKLVDGGMTPDKAVNDDERRRLSRRLVREICFELTRRDAPHAQVLKAYLQYKLNGETKLGDLAKTLDLKIGTLASIVSRQMRRVAEKYEERHTLLCREVG